VIPVATVQFTDILAASERLNGVAHRTPVLTSAAANIETGGELYFKAESLQRMGAFKFRGAYNALSRLSAQERSGGVIAYSSGNHAQAVALASRLLGIRSLIVMPSDAPEGKIAATRGYGAEIRFYDRFTEDREAIGKELAEERGAVLVPPFDHPDVIAGQGTAAKELFESVERLDLLLVPLGGGGLLSGTAIAAQAMAPGCKVIGVEPEAGNDGQRSLRSGERVRIDVPKTIADGAQTQQLGQITFPIIRDLVSDIVTVTDAELVETMRFLATRMKQLVEPTGCLAAAAVLRGKVPVAGQRVGIILSGGNIDLPRFASLVGNEPGAAAAP
jgi:threo-3-hydroxy-L-aspartate ammonia-lyase